MLWIQQIALLTAFSGIFGLSVPTSTDKLLTPPPPLFKCGGSGTNVKCIIERKMGKKKTPITHFFTTKSTGASSFELRIEAVIDGGSRLVYSSRINVTDKRSEGLYVVQIQGAKQNGYKWDISNTDALKATYDLKKKDITFEAVGGMSSNYDNSHGMAPAAVKSATTPPNFDVDNVVKAVSAYFIMEYHKAIRNATTAKFPQ